MRNLSLKVALIVYGAIHIVYGGIMLAAPDKTIESYGFEAVGSFEYFLALLGGCLIAAGIWFIMTSLNILKNASGIRFAILWSAILFVVPLFSTWLKYIDFNHIWFIATINLIFCAAFLAFYPRLED